jgi:protein-S-isoprenylcysteine O-methyltransferase Ste14
MAKGLRVWRVIRNVVEAVAAAVLFSFQYIPYFASWGMLIPVSMYLSVLVRERFPSGDFIILLRYLLIPRLTVDWIVFIAGSAVFLLALVHLLLARGGLVTSGMYSVSRHPQYLGIILTTLGLTITGVGYSNAALIVVETWLLQVVGYVLLAAYEERHLLREFGDDYEAYRQRVSFLLPISRLVRLPEPFFSLLTALIVAFLLLVLWNCLYFRSL